jgi:WD40 repeat protein
MTLPFRRRHHDAETGHDRARMLMSEGLLVSLAPDEAAWLGRHLDGCTECGRDWKAFRADHRALRSLRNRPIEPPRDLWARTSAALDREAQRRGGPAADRVARREPATGGWRALPLGAAAGALVVAVVIGSQLVTAPVPPLSSPPGTGGANVPTAGPTGLALPDADPVAIFRQTPNGAWELVSMEVEEVCVTGDRTCTPKPGGKGQSIDLGSRPSHVALGDRQLVIASEREDGSGGDVLVVPVNGPDGSPPPSGVPTESPTEASPGPPGQSPAATPPGAIAIATGVHVIGDVAYSEDGRWLAFSAAPSDGSTGPDLYVWSVGDPTATAVTTDHQTYFASWHDGRILASRIEVPGRPVAPGASQAPDASAAPDATDKPGRGNGNDEKARATPTPPAPSPRSTDGPGGSGTPGSPAPSIEGHPISFLLDPRSLERSDLTQRDVWLPVLDPSGRLVVYWSGTLRSEDGQAWSLGAGELVLDRWASGEGQGAATPSAKPTTGSASASNEPSPAVPPIGPMGARITLVPGAKATFEASFDPDGTRLAIWVSEGLDEEVGRLHLLVLDRATGEIEPRSPLDGTPALRRFSIDKSRLAWVTPSGQNGRESLVQVLGWKGDEFGEIETEPASDLYLP